PLVPSPRSMAACFTQRVTMLVDSPSSRATAYAVLPGSLHKRTTSALYSSVNVRRFPGGDLDIFFGIILTHLGCPRNRGRVTARVGGRRAEAPKRGRAGPSGHRRIPATRRHWGGSFHLRAKRARCGGLRRDSPPPRSARRSDRRNRSAGSWGRTTSVVASRALRASRAATSPARPPSGP